ncbi:MAG TPA: AsmA-like C-terminal region-containing protein, partial [Chroococcales cyanobacterium]
NKDTLTLKDVGFVTHADKVITTMAIDNLSGAAKLREIKVKSSGIDLADVHYYLSSPVLPAALKNVYTNFFKQYKIADVHGRVNGDALCRLEGEKIFLDGVIGLNDIAVKLGPGKLPVEHIAGTLSASGSQLLVQKLTGAVHESNFEMVGQVDNYRTDKPSWHTEVTASIHPDEMLTLLPSLSDEIAKWNLKLTSSGPLALQAKVTGNPENNDVAFILSSKANDHLILSGPFGIIHQPAGEPLVFDGDMTVNKDQIKVTSTRLLLGDSRLEANGSIKWVKNSNPEDSTKFDITTSEISACVKSPNPMPARKLLSMIDPEMGSQSTSGVVDGFIGLTGTIGSPHATGKITFTKISVPKYDLHDLTGKVEMLQANKEHDIQRARLDFPSIKMGYLKAKDVEADLRFEPAQGNRRQPKIAFENGHAEIAGGTVTMNGSLLVDEHELEVTTDLKKIRAADFTSELVGHPGELTGTLDGEFHITTVGTDYKQALAKLSGDGNVTVSEGTVARFGQLQTKLTQVNLLHQGLFGFNLNNLLQSVVPVRTGRFSELSSSLRVDKGVLYLDDIRYKGDDMRLWGSGKANLNKNAVDIEIAGKIPRVSPSFLSGTFGEVSRSFTIQKMMHGLTRGQLEALPSVPFLGDLASDKPRIFSFKVNSQLDQPKTVATSIEKSFHWLPSRPTASAHPVPGLGN